MSAELVVLLQGVRAGVVRQHRGDLSLAYDHQWQSSDGGYPLSLSLPLAQREHGDELVRSYLEGLLPDSAHVLEQWGRRFGVSARNPFSLLQHVGEDIAGAAQFVTPERVDALARREGAVEWLDQAEVAELLGGLRTDQSAWRPAGATGQFSLAGAQPKTALLLQDGRWGIPAGAIPTTHILKPPLLDLDHLAGNEHLCLRLAQELEISAANSSIMRFGDQIAIVVERYDRAVFDGRLIRLHQEDLCQSAGVTPRTKYESEGGPGAGAILGLLRDNSSAAAEDMDRFVAALAFNWAIGGSDAHAKKYSVLIGPGQVRLAPLYDLVSVLPYPTMGPAGKVRLAMRIGGEAQAGRIAARHWHRLAEAGDLDAEHVVARATEVVGAVHGSVAKVIDDAVEEGVDERFARAFGEVVRANAANCARALRPSP